MTNEKRELLCNSINIHCQATCKARLLYTGISLTAVANLVVHVNGGTKAPLSFVLSWLYGCHPVCMSVCLWSKKAPYTIQCICMFTSCSATCMVHVPGPHSQCWLPNLNHLFPNALSAVLTIMCSKTTHCVERFTTCLSLCNYWVEITLNLRHIV